MPGPAVQKGESTNGRKRPMKEGLTNAGKKEQRQINQLLNKEVKEGRQTVKDVEGRTVPKQHRLKRRKGKVR
jgi:hypothetical protein